LKINAFAVSMSPALVWIKNTFSTFSAAGITVGLLVTAAIFFSGISIGFNSLSSHRPMRGSWLMLYLAAWLFMAKWDPSAWVALGLLLSMHKIIQREPMGSTAGSIGESQTGVKCHVN
jgi:fatty-acid desaturase